MKGEIKTFDFNDLKNGECVFVELKKDINTLIFYNKKEMCYYLKILYEKQINLKNPSTIDKEKEFVTWIKVRDFNQKIFFKGLISLKEPYRDYEWDMKLLFLYQIDEFFCFRYGLIIEDSYLTFKNWLVYYDSENDLWFNKEKKILVDPYLYSDLWMKDVPLELEKWGLIYLLGFLKK